MFTLVSEFSSEYYIIVMHSLAYIKFLKTDEGQKALMDSEPHLWGVTDQVERFCQRHKWLLKSPELQKCLFLTDRLPYISITEQVRTAFGWMEPHLLGVRWEL